MTDTDKKPIEIDMTEDMKRLAEEVDKKGDERKMEKILLKLLTTENIEKLTEREENYILNVAELIEQRRLETALMKIGSVSWLSNAESTLLRRRCDALGYPTLKEYFDAKGINSDEYLSGE